MTYFEKLYTLPISLAICGKTETNFIQWYQSMWPSQQTKAQSLWYFTSKCCFTGYQMADIARMDYRIRLSFIGEKCGLIIKYKLLPAVFDQNMRL